MHHYHYRMCIHIPIVAVVLASFALTLTTVSGFTLSMMSAQSTPTSYGFKSKSVVVVGGGPVGLAASLMLRKRGFEDVTIIEKRVKGEYEEGKAYLYMIDGRGQKITNTLGLTEKITERSFNSKMFDSLNEVLPNGQIRVKSVPVDKKAIEKYWLPRYELLDILQKEAEDSGVKFIYNTAVNGFLRSKDGGVAVTIKCGDTEAIGLAAATATGNPNAIASDTQDTYTLHPTLLLGCDGINSALRKWLAKHAPPTYPTSKADDVEGATRLVNKERFEPLSFNSDSAGLQYKMFSLKDQFPLPVYDVKAKKNLAGKPGVAPVLSQPGKAYAIRSTGNTASTRLSLGLLAVKDGVRRTANIICRPDHKIWSLQTAQEVRDFLEKSFPQIDMQEFVADEEIARFAAAPPGVFPKPQYCRGMQQLFYDNAASFSSSTSLEFSLGKERPKFEKEKSTDDEAREAKKRREKLGPAMTGLGERDNEVGDGIHRPDHLKTAVLLAGDAVHAFPPDLGQGVNSGLEDIQVLHDCLETTYDDVTKALPMYELRRVPEAHALVELMQFGYPYQYNQAPLKQKLFMANFSLRLLLNKLFPKTISPPAFFLAQDHTISYREVIKRAHHTTKVLVSSLAITIAAIATGLLRSFFPSAIRSIRAAVVAVHRLLLPAPPVAPVPPAL